MDHSSFGNLGAAGGSSSGGSNSVKPSAASSSFLQLPLSTAAAAAAGASPTGGGVAYYGAPLALLHQSASAAAAGPSHPPPSYAKLAAEISPAEADAIKAKIVAHPQYSALLAAYLDCQKVSVFALHAHTSRAASPPVKIEAFFFSFSFHAMCRASQDLLNLMRNLSLFRHHIYVYMASYI